MIGSSVIFAAALSMHGLDFQPMHGSSPPRLEAGREVSYCLDHTLDIAYLVTPGHRAELTSITVDGQAVSDDELRIINSALTIFAWLTNVSAQCDDDQFFVAVEGRYTQAFLDLYARENTEGVDDTYTLRFVLTGPRLTREPETPIRSSGD